MSPDPPPLGSVVIPAWNEASVIGRTLSALHRGVAPGTFDVVVAYNGCTDDTVEIVRRSGFPVTILDLPAVGKARAIRAAEGATQVMPRLYLDADVELPGPSAVDVLRALSSGAIGARPPAVHDLSGATRWVRWYYRARDALPGLSGELYGAGVYGLSEEARGRFDEFPDVVADDLFAARIVPPAEVLITASSPVVVRPPRDARSLIDTLTRVQRGNRELVSARPALVSSTTGSTVRGLIGLGRDLRLWPAIVVFGVSTVIARVRSRLAASRWERDDSARTVAVGT